MATVTFALKEFEAEGFHQRQLEELALKIGMEVESIENGEITLSITPNRPDLLDFTGLVRALKHFTRKSRPRAGDYKELEDSGVETVIGATVKRVRPFAAAAVVRDVDLSGNRLKNMINFTEKLATTYGRKRKKMAIGLHNLDAISGSLTYDAAKDGRITPLGTKRRMDFEHVMKQHDKGRGYSEAISGKGGETLYPYLKDADRVLALIPIINSEDTRVTESTKNLLVFVDGTSKKAVDQTLSALACSIKDAGAKVYACHMKTGNKMERTPQLRSTAIKVKKRDIDETIGIAMDMSGITQLANRMGYPAESSGDTLTVHVPPYRTDVLNEQDVIEDLAIAYGYDRIAMKSISSSSIGQPEKATPLHNRLATLMVGLGFTEAINSYLTNEKTCIDAVRARRKKEELITLMNSKTETATMLRTSILPGLLSNLAASFNERMPLRLFELGNTFVFGNGRIKEGIHLAFASEHARANFAEARAAVEPILSALGWNCKMEEHSDPTFIEGRCAKAVRNGRDVAVFGEVHPAVLKSFGIEEPTIAAEIVLSEETAYEA